MQDNNKHQIIEFYGFGTTQKYINKLRDNKKPPFMGYNSVEHYKEMIDIIGNPLKKWMAELEEEKWGENRQELIEMYEGFIKGQSEKLNEYQQKLKEEELKVEKEKFVIEMFENTIAVPEMLDVRHNKRHLSRKANELYQQKQAKVA